MNDKTKQNQPTQAELKAKKRAENMRANLMRRKQQQRQRQQDSKDD